MEEENVLGGGIKELSELKNLIIEINDSNEKIKELETTGSQLEKNLTNKEKIMKEEIELTLKKRKDEISSTYDAQIETTKIRLKKVRGKKEKSKNVKVSERIKIETADLREENKNLKSENKTYFKQNHIPRVCNSKLYYSLFSPKSLIEILIALLVTAITLFVIPCGIYYFLIPVKKIIYLAIIYVVVVILAGGGYIAINNNTKVKYRKIIKRGREYRDEIRKNNKQIKRISKKIRKDKDESTYELDKYNEEISELESQMNEIANQKKEALLSYDKTTSSIVENEIKGRYKDELENLEKEHESFYKEEKELENKVKELNMNLANQYEVYLGKEFMSLEKTEKLIEIMDEKKTATVSEAVTIYKSGV